MSMRRPMRPDKSKLPVMFWIHGGGYSGGASSEPRHNGDFLPLKGVVLVTINYRLGVFGFLATTDLAKEGKWLGRELRPDGHGGRAALGQGKHRELRRRSRQRDHLRRERRVVCGEHADGFADGAGAVPKGDWRERRGVSERRELGGETRGRARQEGRRVGGFARRQIACRAARTAHRQDS